jgi:lysophospholipase L1-like esterase
LTVILQNPRLDASRRNQEAKVAAIRKAFAERPEIDLIDVWAAFQDATSLPPMIRDDNFHPSPAGQLLWSETVKAALGIDNSA